MSLIETIRSCRRVSGLAAVALATAVPSSQAGTLTVQVLDTLGLPLADAAVYLEAANYRMLPKSSARIAPVVIEVNTHAFVPKVTIAQVGSMVSFINHDSVRHHVYSFSAPKVFELKLSAGMPGARILFDKPGTVIVGCNTHDSTVAFVQVVNSPYFARTNAAGVARIDRVDAGKFTIRSWHPLQVQQEQTPVADDARAVVVTNTDATASIRVAIKPLLQR